VAGDSWLAVVFLLFAPTKLALIASASGYSRLTVNVKARHAVLLPSTQEVIMARTACRSFFVIGLALALAWPIHSAPAQETFYRLVFQPMIKYWLSVAIQN